MIVRVSGNIEEMEVEPLPAISFDTNSSITIRPRVKKPACKKDQGRVFELPSQYIVSCYLLSAAQTIIKSLNNCRVRPTDNLAKNQTYFIRFYTDLKD